MQNSYHLWGNLYSIQIFSFLKAAILVIGGVFCAQFGSNASRKLLTKYTTSQQSMLLQKVVYFAVLILFLIAALQQLGFKLAVLLGSAGIVTAAIAIASQTTISNMISGVFLILEKSFQVGDRIKIGNTQGTVMSIDLLSVKLLTPSNTLIRLPNENLIKAEITNLSRFDVRRVDIPLTVSTDEDIAQIKSQLLNIVRQNNLISKTPSPSISIKDIDGQNVQLQLSVWAHQKNIDSLPDHLYTQILLVFKENNIQF